MTNAREPFCIEPFSPAYRALASDAVAARVQEGLRELASCCACPRACRVDRLGGQSDLCRTARHALVTSAFAHFGEEDCLRGTSGSGTIFFGGCNLRCVFCQNWDISQRASGRPCSAEEIAQLMLALQARGCHNVNFVTPEHVVPQVLEAVAAAIARGLRVPIVYNTSAYDSVASLRLLDGIVDIYMPDFKLWERASSARLLGAKDYPERAREAIAEMHRQVGVLRLGPDGVARRGLLVRHLVMPGLGHESAAIFRWLATALSPDTYVNIMGQYRPEHRVGRPGRDGSPRFPAIDRRPADAELRDAYAAARAAGLWRFDARRLAAS
jgi:putative pyruvate formate lyase activating enzyme